MNSRIRGGSASWLFGWLMMTTVVNDNVDFNLNVRNNDNACAFAWCLNSYRYSQVPLKFPLFFMTEIEDCVYQKKKKRKRKIKEQLSKKAMDRTSSTQVQPSVSAVAFRGANSRSQSWADASTIMSTLIILSINYTLKKISFAYQDKVSRFCEHEQTQKKNKR